MYADPWSQPDAEEAAATPAQKSLQSTSAESDLSAFWPSRFDLGGPTKVSPSEQQLNAVGWPILASIWRDEQEPARQEPEPAFASWADRPEVPESAPELGCALSTLPSLAFALPTLEPVFEVQPKSVETSQPSADELLEASMHARVECVLDLIEDDGDDEIPEEEYDEVKPAQRAYVNYRNNNDDDFASDVESELEALMDDEFCDEDDFPTDERPYYLAMGILPRFKLVPGPNEWAPPPPLSSSTSSSASARTERTSGPRHSRRAAPAPCAASAEQAAAFARFQARNHHLQQLPEEPSIDDWHFTDRPTVLPTAHHHPTYYRTPPNSLPYPYPLSDLEVYPFLT